jgi:hypothetical protein
METCENCGLPSWCVKGEGVTIQIEAKPENKFQRTRKRSVWCHSDECAIQCLGLSKYGNDTSRWPITFGQFRAMKPLEVFRKSKPSRRSLEYRQAQMYRNLTRPASVINTTC